MQLELKESNSPFWLIGAGKNKTFTGSSTNVACFAKSRKKQEELAKQILKDNDNVKEVYLITGTQWDNMPSGAKEEFGYIKNKGKLILSREQLSEYDYPKGVSRDPLPKKGVKTYTSVATALEGKGDKKMKLELKEENIVSVDNIPEDLQDRFFITMSDGRPEMFKKFTKDELKLFADFVKQLPDNEITDFERSMVLVAISLAHGDDFTVTENVNLSEISDYNKKLIKELETEFGANMITSAKEEDNKLILFIDSSSNQADINEYLVNKGIENIELDTTALSPKIIITESKIVTPVGNPQTAGSFVNIDVDLDHMEVSDFIVRLAQAIRSEQTSVLEYVAMRSANGITNEERTNIDSIIEEEKNHMVAFTTMLYKQILTNHKQNVDGANDEFTLPTFGMEIFDNSEDGKLTESVALTIEKIAAKEASGIRMSDEYFIGNREDGRVYHGLGVAMSTIKDMISTSGDEIVVQNVTLNDSVTEDIKTKFAGETMSQQQWDIVVDVDYDADFQMQVVNNLTNAIQAMNPETAKSDKYAIAEDKYTLAGDKFNFEILTYDGFNKTVDENFVTDVCNKLFAKASTYEYYIKLA